MPGWIKAVRFRRKGPEACGMGDIVNLRKARKARDRREKQARAAENRAAHGIPKRVKTTARAEREREDRVHDGHRSSDDGDGESQ